MLTIILPGYSEHNRDWAEEMKIQMKLDHDVIVHHWMHWSGGSFSLKSELLKILDEVGGARVNVIAKSVGVYVALNLIPKISSQVNKVILCGIASITSDDRKALVKTVLKSIPADNILCVQNENDKFVKFIDAEKFYHSVEPKLKVVSKPRSDHEYPYPDDFRKYVE